LRTTMSNGVVVVPSSLYPRTWPGFPAKSPKGTWWDRQEPSVTR